SARPATWIDAPRARRTRRRTLPAPRRRRRRPSPRRAGSPRPSPTRGRAAGRGLESGISSTFGSGAEPAAGEEVSTGSAGISSARFRVHGPDLAFVGRFSVHRADLPFIGPIWRSSGRFLENRPDRRQIGTNFKVRSQALIAE